MLSGLKCKRCGCFIVGAIFRSRDYCASCKSALDAEGQRQRVLGRELCESLAGLLKRREFVAEKVAYLREEFAERGLRDDQPARLQLYKGVTAAFAADKVITPAERSALTQCRQILHLPEEEVEKVDGDLARMEQIWALDRGELPQVQDVGVPLQRGEVGRVVFSPVEFHQERVVKRGYVGGSSGASIRICKGVTYRVGAHRGEYVTSSALVYLDSGRLVLTSKRLIFAGSTKGFAIPFAKLLSVTAYGDGISVVKDSVAANSKPFVLLYADAEILKLAVSACMNAS